MRTFELGPDLQIVFNGEVVPFSWDREKLLCIRQFNDLVAFADLTTDILSRLEGYDLTDEEVSYIVLCLESRLLSAGKNNRHSSRNI